MRSLVYVPDETMMSLMSSTLGMHGYASKADCHGARGDVRALQHREEGLEPRDTW
jgi:hypothetical protein